MKVAVIQHSDGISIVHPAKGKKIEDVIERSNPDNLPVTLVNLEDLPISREFRNAWKTQDKKVEVDIDKAKSLHMARIRAARNKKLEELDKETMKALSDSSALAVVEAKKQKLRDLPQDIDLSKLDISKPKELWPEDLELPPEYEKST